MLYFAGTRFLRRTKRKENANRNRIQDTKRKPWPKTGDTEIHASKMAIRVFWRLTDHGRGGVGWKGVGKVGKFGKNFCWDELFVGRVFWQVNFQHLLYEAAFSCSFVVRRQSPHEMQENIPGSCRICRIPTYALGSLSNFKIVLIITSEHWVLNHLQAKMMESMKL